MQPNTLLGADRHRTLQAVSITENSDARFSIALVRLVRYFNLLDENVGLCISHLASPSDPQASYPALAKMTAEQKMERLLELFTSQEIISDEGSISEFAGWFERAAQARSIRNRYVHGHWEYLPMRSEKPVGVRAPAWMQEKLGPDANETMSLSDLETVADELVGVFEDFVQIRKKNGV